MEYTLLILMKYFFTLLISILFAFTASSQSTVKKYTASRTEKAPKIDGILDDDVWQNVPFATDFVELQPTAGRHEIKEERPEEKIIYDNTAIYVAARMYETDSKKIARELTTRDNVAADDFFGIILDTY